MAAAGSHDCPADLTNDDVSDDEVQVVAVQSSIFEYEVEPKSEELEVCPICYDPCELIGDHRLTSLPCGHVFGESCIEEWLKQKLCCPNCKCKVGKKAIRPIAMVNNGGDGYQQAKKALEQEKAVTESLHQQLRHGKIDRNKAERELRILTGHRRQATTLLRQAQSKAKRLQCKSSTAYSFLTPRSTAKVWSEAGGGICFTNVQHQSVVGCGYFALLDLKSHSNPTFYKPHRDWLIDASISGAFASPRFVTVAEGCSISVTEARTPQPTHCTTLERQPTRCMFSRDVFSHVVVGDEEGGVSVFDLRSFGAPVHQFSIPCTPESTFVNWLHYPGLAVEHLEHIVDPLHGTSAVLTAGYGGVNMFDLHNNKVTQLHLPEERHSVSCNADLQQILVSTPTTLHVHSIAHRFATLSKFKKKEVEEEAPVDLSSIFGFKVPERCKLEASPTSIETESGPLQAVLATRMPILDYDDVPSFGCYAHPQSGVIVQSLINAHEPYTIPTSGPVKCLQLVTGSGVERTLAFLDGTCLQLWKV